MQAVADDIFYSIYQYLGFGLIFAVICMIALPEVEHKGLKKCLIHQWHKLRTDKITRYNFAFFTILFMVLSRTLICRSIWQCPWENIIGEWGVFASDGTLNTEGMLNVLLFVPLAYFGVLGFFQQDGYYHVDYSLFSDHDNYVFMSLDYQIPLLESNYKRSLVERVYRDKKLLFMKIKVMIQKFILSFLDDYYHGRKIYDRYFLFLPSEIFEKKEDVDVILQMVAQPFLQRYLVLGIPSAISVTQGLFRKYPHFSFACCQDLRYISDVSGKLATLDTSGLYDYLVIEGYKPKSLEEIQKYACVVVRDILFRKDV